MANNLAPFGFRPVNTSNGPINWRISTRRIQQANANPIYKGDAVVNMTGPANGYIDVATNALTITTPLAGIFWGCQYLSASQKRTVWNQYWPGSDAVGDVIAYVIDDPNARFVVQSISAGFQFGAGGTPTNFVSSPIGQLCNIDNSNPTGVDQALTQQSTMTVTTPGTSAALPFIVTNLVLDPPGSNGTDASAGSLYNWVEVGFNNEWLRGNAGVSGIS